METSEQEGNVAASTTDVPVDDEPIVDPESLLDVEFDEEDEDESDIIMNDDGQEGIELQGSE
jgi:hypothetical protein